MTINETSVLVIDDDPVSRQLLLLLLCRQGYPVKTADSGAQALEYLRAQVPLDTKVILADLQMPGITGSALAGALREICKADTTLIAMSGSSPDEAVAADYDSFLLKPFTMEDLASAIAGHRKAHPASPVVQQELPALNQTVYQRISATMDAKQMDQLYRFCLDDAKRRVANMRQSAVNGDDTSYRREAHAIKGGCGMVGASELQRLAASMEDSGIAANHVATLDEFVLACERLERMLNARKAATG